MKIKNFNLTYGTQIFKAFSDDSRIRILHLLYQNQQMCITDLEQVLEFTQSKTSRHLTYLKNAGLTNARKNDQWVYYYLKDEVMEIVQQFFKYLEKDPVLIKDQQHYKTMYSNRELAINKLQNKRYGRE